MMNKLNIALLLLILVLGPIRGMAQDTHYPDKIGVVRHNHIALQVADMKASAQFYGELLELERIELTDPRLKDIRAWFKIGDQQIHLLAGRTQPVVNDRNGSHFAVFVADIAQTEAYLKKREVTYHAQTRFDGVKQIYIADPDGYLVEFNQLVK